MGNLKFNPNQPQQLAIPGQLFSSRASEALPHPVPQSLSAPTLPELSLSLQLRSGSAPPSQFDFFGGIKTKPLTIQLYPSYGHEQSVHVKGRVIKTPEVEHEDNPLWDTFKQNVKSLSSREKEDIWIDVRFNQHTVRVQSDEEGMFEFDMSDFGPISPGYHQLQATLAPQAKPRYRAEPATGLMVIQPRQDHSFGIVSDIDDTIQKTDVTHKLQALKNLLFNNEQSSAAFAGMAVLYQILERRSDGVLDGDVTYISGSPSGLSHRLEGFLAVKGFPQGAMELKTMGFEKGEDNPFKQTDYKLEHLRKLFETYPDKQFYLFGDNGEADPEIYRQIAQAFPGRVLGIYINNVTQDVASAPRYADMKLSNNAAESAQDLFLRGVISREDLAAVQQAVQQGQ